MYIQYNFVKNEIKKKQKEIIIGGCNSFRINMLSVDPKTALHAFVLISNFSLDFVEMI